MRQHFECSANGYVFRSRLNCSGSTAGSRRWLDSKFQTFGPATENAKTERKSQQENGRKCNQTPGRRNASHMHKAHEHVDIDSLCTITGGRLHLMSLTSASWNLGIRVQKCGHTYVQTPATEYAGDKAVRKQLLVEHAVGVITCAEVAVKTAKKQLGTWTEVTATGTDTQTYKQTNKYTDRQTNRHRISHRHTNRTTSTETDRQTDR